MCCVLRRGSDLQYKPFRPSIFISISLEIPMSVCMKPDFTWTCKLLKSVKVTWQSEEFSEVFVTFFAVGLGTLRAMLCCYCLRSLLLLCWRWWEVCRRFQVPLCFTSVNPISSCWLPFWIAEVQNLSRKQRCLKSFRQKINVLGKDCGSEYLQPKFSCTKLKKKPN